MNRVKQNELYANLMGELKVRVDAINTALAGRTGLPPPLVREFCYHQLRFLCELIALSCLVAHGDLKSLQSHQTGKAYSADEMLKKLSELRPHFYPWACRQERAEPSHASDGRRNFHIDGNIPQPFTKQDLLSLYGKTHKHLHRGTFKALIAADAPIDMNINLPEIVTWAQRIHDHMRMHTIVVSEKLLIICILRNRDNANKVQVANLERSSQQPALPPLDPPE